MSANPFLFLALTVAAAPPVTATPAAPKAEPLSSRAMYDRAVRGTVYVESKFKPSSGTGWIVDGKRKLIVTNYHVAPEGDVLIYFPIFENGRIVSNPRKYAFKGVPGKVIDSDPKVDLSVIEVRSIPAGMHELKLAAEEPQPGDRLHSVGNPGAGHGLFVYTTGTVRQVSDSQMRFADGQHIQCRFIEGQVAINPGDSGSASLNEYGEVVGVNFAIPTVANVRGFAWIIALEEVRAFINDVVELKGTQARAATYERRAGRLYRKLKDDAALADLDRAIALDPKLASAYLQRTLIHRSKRNYDAALADGYKAVDLQPKDRIAYNERGHAFYFRGDYRRALADYSKAIELSPNEAVLWTNRGRIHSRMNDSERALKDFAQAVKLNSLYSETYRERGQLYLKKRDHKKAAADFEAGLKLNPTDADFLTSLGVARVGEGRLAEAAEALGKALNAKPANPAAVWQKLGEVRLSLKQYDLALAAADQVVKLAPRSAEGWALRGKVQEVKGEVDDAQGDYNKAVELDARLESYLPRFNRRQVKVNNLTGETLKVFVRYERTIGSGAEVKTPEKGWLEYTIAPGSTLLLGTDDKPVETRKLRIWAQGTRSGKKFDSLKGRDIVLVDESYRATRIDAHVHRFGD